MNKKIFVFFLLFLALGCTVAFAQVLKTVVIDAGHGGKDSGTMARSHHHKHEKHIALAIAKKLGEYIEEKYPSLRIIYTRKSDVYLTLKKRAEIANKAGADLFISVHVDAVGNTRVKGASVYVLGLHRTKENLKVAMRENAVMLQEEDYKTQYAGFNPNDAESYIIFSLMQNQYLNNSMTMAALVNKHLKAETHRYTKGVKQAGFYVLREVAMPSILVETGYITNSSDARFLCSKKGQEKTARAIFKAFLEYKKILEKNTVDLKVKPQIEKQKEPKEDTFFSVQLLYSPKDIPSDSKFFKGLSPVFRKENRYFYGKTTSYSSALGLQKQARRYFKDAFLVGFEKGAKTSLRKVRKLLKQER